MATIKSFDSGVETLTYSSSRHASACVAGNSVQTYVNNGAWNGGFGTNHFVAP